MKASEGSRSIGVRAAHGVLWTGAGQIARQVVQIVGSIVLARLLAPDEFGLLGMALFFVGIGQLLADFGIGSAIVQARSSDRVILSSCFWLNFGIAAALAVVMVAASPLVAAFYKRADLAVVVAVLSVNLLLAGIQVVPQALLYRDMRFADLARIQVIGGLAGAVVAITLAWFGAGVWALVAQPLVGSTVGLAISFAALRWRPYLEFSWPRVEPLARFSFALLGTNLVDYANRNVDTLLIGRFLGSTALGLYSMAIQLMLYPLQQVSSVVVRVLFPTLVQLGDDLPRLRAAYLKAVGAIAFLAFPMTGGLFAVADELVAVVFGADWAGMAPVLKIVAWVGMMQSVGTTVGTIYLTVGKPHIALRVTMVATPILTIAFAAGLAWGLVGVAIGYAIATCFLFYYTIRQAFRLIDLRVAAMHAVIARPFAATLVMIAVVLVVGALIMDLAQPVRLAIMIASGVASYALASAIVNREQIRELVGILRSLHDSRSA